MLSRELQRILDNLHRELQEQTFPAWQGYHHQHHLKHHLKRLHHHHLHMQVVLQHLQLRNLLVQGLRLVVLDENVVAVLLYVHFYGHVRSQIHQQVTR